MKPCQNDFFPGRYVNTNTMNIIYNLGLVGELETHYLFWPEVKEKKKCEKSYLKRTVLQ